MCFVFGWVGALVGSSLPLGVSGAPLVPLGLPGAPGAALSPASLQAQGPRRYVLLLVQVAF